MGASPMSHASHSQYSSPGGDEYFLVLESPLGLCFTESCDKLFEAYEDRLRSLGLDVHTEVFLRFYLSDITCQADLIRQKLEQKNRALTFYSLIGQPPCEGGKIGIQAYHIKAKVPIRKGIYLSNGIIVAHGPYHSIWTSHCPSSSSSAYRQTAGILRALEQDLNRLDGLVAKNTLRTWIYLSEINNDYQGMVQARKDFFRKIGLIDATHYIASTGIGASMEHLSHRVKIDSLNIMGLNPQQVEFMHAPEHMNAPCRYGVTFERGTKVSYGDRTHLYVSGTASIDNEGHVLYEDQVEKQTQRSLMNIEALLDRNGSSLNDLKVCVVYLRNPRDLLPVKTFLEDNLPDRIPRLVVKGAVCRSQWLIEIEGIAITAPGLSVHPAFC